MGRGWIPGWHRMGNREDLGQVGRDHHVRTVEFVPREQRGGDLVRPTAHSHSITQKPVREREDREGGMAVDTNLQASHTFVFLQNEKIT